LIHALQQGSDIVGQLSALSERVALSDRIGDSSAIRLRLAADTADARVLNYEDSTSLLPELQAQLIATELDGMRRIRAARTLMIAADNLLDETLARQVYDAMPGQPLSTAESLLKGQVDLIFHTVFGDREAALLLAESLSQLADSQEPSPASVSAQLSASLALRIVGSAPIDTRRLERLFDRCVACSMFDAATRTSARIGSFKYEDGAVESAQLWCERTSNLVAQTRAERLCADHITLQIDLALERGDLRSAQRLVDSAPSQCPMYKSPRYSREYLVYRLRVAQHRGDSPGSGEDVERLVEWHKRAKRLGRQDDCMQVLWTAFWSVGRRAEASSLLRDYLLNARKERRAASHMLRTRTCEDPIWRELAASCVHPAIARRDRYSVIANAPADLAQPSRHTRRRGVRKLPEPNSRDSLR
jgi:hypothetical protein